MSCVYPLDAWRAAKCNDSGKRGVVFNIRDGFSDQPLQIPCGKCPGCSADKAKIWAVRLHHEASQHDQNCFLTLTYADAPPHISIRDCQLFVKRLRSHCKFRYFLCGEYGTLSRRPHYHAIIFGQDFLGGAYDISDTLYGNDVVSRAWGKGYISIGAVNMASCSYVSGYVNKKLGDPDTFNLMSRRPGLGRTWLEKYREDIVRTGTISIEGREYPIPKKYLEWYPEDFSKLKAERQAFFDKLSPADRHERALRVRPAEKLYLARQRDIQERI